MAILKCGFVLLMLLVMGGCSIKLMYNNADRLARWGVSDYIKMDDEQEAYFIAEADLLHYWHRTSELPLYANYLDAMPAKFDEEVDEEAIEDIFETLYSWWEVFEQQAMPMATEILLSLSDEQVARLPGRLEKGNRELAEDELDKPLDEIQKEWGKEYSDTMSRFSGRLTKLQREYIDAQSVRYVPQFELWSDYHRRWQVDLLTLLREKRDDPEAFTEGLVMLSEGREDYYGEELTAVFDGNKLLASEVTAWLINNLTDKQRERFNERIDEMATSFRELAADVPDEIPQGGGCLVTC